MSGGRGQQDGPDTSLPVGGLLLAPPPSTPSHGVSSCWAFTHDASSSGADHSQFTCPCPGEKRYPSLSGLTEPSLNMRIKSRTTLNQNPAPALPYCETLAQFLYLSVPVSSPI